MPHTTAFWKQAVEQFPNFVKYDVFNLAYEAKRAHKVTRTAFKAIIHTENPKVFDQREPNYKTNNEVSFSQTPTNLNINCLNVTTEPDLYAAACALGSDEIVLQSPTQTKTKLKLET